ncbi:plasmolipin-like isoform X2 [Mytilus trossulus]|uniref:plasmolipin-like isoform X2 n=1 Tax=Mytilus trossulus TaxID=6551 RepID=UPI0030044EC3
MIYHMPVITTVSTHQTTNTTTEQNSNATANVELDKVFMKSTDSILKIAELILSLIVFLCITSNPWHSYVGGGWVQFNSMSCMITVLILWLLLLCRVIYKLPGFWMLYILIHYVVYLVLYLISFLVCAIQAGKYQENGGLIASTIFCFIVLIVLAVDTFSQFRRWQESGGKITVRTTTKTETTHETEADFL